MPHQTMEDVAKKWVVPLRGTFTLQEHYAFIRDVEQLRIRRPIEHVMDEVASLAQSSQYKEQYIMAKKAPVEVKTPAKRKPKAAAEASPAVPREPKVPTDTKLVWLTKENPKRPGSASHERFEGYLGAKTVEAFLEAGGTRADLAHDMGKGYVSIN